jgi:hypothetical protein
MKNIIKESKNTKNVTRLKVRENLDAISKSCDINSVILNELETSYKLEQITNKDLEQNDIKNNLKQQKAQKDKIYNQDEETKNRYAIFRKFQLGNLSSVNTSSNILDDSEYNKDSVNNEMSNMSNLENEDIINNNDENDNPFSNSENQTMYDLDGESYVRNEQAEGSMDMSNIEGDNEF